LDGRLLGKALGFQIAGSAHLGKPGGGGVCAYTGRILKEKQPIAGIKYAQSAI
jgi:hypothetical protein